jgi:YqjK-like protein
VKQNMRSTALAIHREVLIQRSDMQRQSMAAHLRPLRETASRIDSRVRATRMALGNPVVVGAAAGLLFIIGPRRILGYVKRGAELWLMSRSWLPRLATLLMKRAD